MPFFQYTATNSQGQQIQGSVQAGSLDEANRALSLQGFRVAQIFDARQAPAQTIAAPMPPTLRAEAARPQQAPPPTRVNMPAPKPMGHPVKTKLGTDKDNYFLFSQIAGYLNTGINPSQAFNDVAMRIRREDYRQAFQRVSRDVAEGGSIADTLSLYPYLFPAHVAGTIRAGEVGGYLPEAVSAISDQADSSRKLRRWFVWLGLAALSVIVCYPILKIVFDGTLRTWDAQEKAGGTAPGTATFMQEMWVVLKWPVGPITLIVAIICVILAFVWQSMRFTELRHRLALSVPTVRKRTKAESFAAFAWHMSNLSRTGIAPLRTWMLAADTVPNQAIRASLLDQGHKMTEQTKLSEALFNTRMLPEEYAPMVQTGEITGDIPGQLMNASRMSQEDFTFQDKASKGRIGCWILLLTFGVGMLLIYAMYGQFWGQLIPKVTGD